MKRKEKKFEEGAGSTSTNMNSRPARLFTHQLFWLDVYTHFRGTTTPHHPTSARPKDHGLGGAAIECSSSL
jgi:hypothetical protein